MDKLIASAEFAILRETGEVDAELMSKFYKKWKIIFLFELWLARDMRRANALLLNVMLWIIIFRESSNWYTCGLLQSNFILVEQMNAQKGSTILDSFTI